MWESQIVLSKYDVKNVYKQILIDQFCQKMYSDMNVSTRGQLYSNLKTSWSLEQYLLKLPNFFRKLICKLRCSNVKIPVEKGRWVGVPREQRFCHLCSEAVVGDEYHYLFMCKCEQVMIIRDKYIPVYYVDRPSQEKMYGLLSLCNTPVLKKLAIFVKHLIKLL